MRRPHVAGDDLEARLPAVGVAPARGERRQARLQLDADADRRRIARQQQERQRAGAAADVEEPAVGRREKPLQQYRIEAHPRAARRLEDADAPRPQRVGGDRLLVLAHNRGRDAAPSRRYITSPVASLGRKYVDFWGSTNPASQAAST